MTITPQPSGVDLARPALLAAREAAQRTGHARKTKPGRRTGTALRRDGREPLGLGSAISQMMTERGLAAPAAGGSVLAQFDTILAAAAPELAGHVTAVRFDAGTGRLDVAPEAPAYGTKLRWIAPKLIATAAAVVPTANIHILNILPPSPGKAGFTAEAVTPAAPQSLVPTVGPGQPRTRHPGYLASLAAHHATGGTPKTGLTLLIREAATRQTQALRRNREPEVVFTEIAAQEEILRTRQRRTGHDGTLEASIRAALTYKRRGAPGPGTPARAARASWPSRNSGGNPAAYGYFDKTRTVPLPPKKSSVGEQLARGWR
ncbi:DUF721 domain-containing protein [Streptomyces sp. NPDC001732]